MGKLEFYLKELNISYKIINSKDKEEYTMLCITKYNHAKIPFIISIDENQNSMCLYSADLCTIDLKNEKQVIKLLKTLNEFNSETLYGTAYLDDDGKVTYSIGVSLEPEVSYPEFYKFQDYIHCFFQGIYDLVKSFNNKGFYNENK